MEEFYNSVDMEVFYIGVVLWTLSLLFLTVCCACKKRKLMRIGYFFAVISAFITLLGITFFK